MKEWIQEKLIAVILFFALLFGSGKILPYFLTHTSYDQSSRISGLFPLAVKINGTPSVIRWGEYERAQNHAELFLIRAGTSYHGSGPEPFTLEGLPNGDMALKLSTDDYIFWSRYAVRDGQAVPISLWFNGPFIFFMHSRSRLWAPRLISICLSAASRAIGVTRTLKTLS